MLQMWVRNVHLIVGIFLCLVLSEAHLMLIPKRAELIRTDEERTVVMTALCTYSHLLKEIKVLERGGHRNAIITRIEDAMTHKVSISDLFLFCNKFVICQIEFGQKCFRLS
jgi:hypothetical protein